jgi:hypothetical protein
MHRTGPATDMDGAHARSWRQHYHIGRPGVTGGNAEVDFVTYNGRGLFLPAGWRLTPPEPGEPISAYFDRAIYGHQLVWDIFALADGRKLALPKGLDSIRPAERTFEWWRKTYPYSGRDKTLKESLEYDLARLVWRLLVALFDQFRAGDQVVVEGRRMDVSTSEVELVKRGLWQNDFMVLRPRHRRGGLFVPEAWQERQPPTTLTESYRELTLWPAKASETKQKARPRVHFPKLLHWWITEYLPQYPEPDKRPNVETQRMDAAAAFPDHSPPTERTMQTLRAAKGTPPEWREVGRRPNSD